MSALSLLSKRFSSFRSLQADTNWFIFNSKSDESVSREGLFWAWFNTDMRTSGLLVIDVNRVL